jgi:hypothetical protein
MHTTHTDPWRILTAALAAFVVAMAAALLMSGLGNLELGGGDGSAATAQPTTSSATPTWVANPIASPIADLRSTE